MKVDGQDRKSILARLRALLSMTVANGCTEAEAIAAARAAARLMDRYNFSPKDADEPEERFTHRASLVPDDVGERLWRPAVPIAALTGTRYWVTLGESREVNFFGRDSDVEIAGYFLAICESAMRRGLKDFEPKMRLFRSNVRRRQILAFLDGMANRLRKTLEEIQAARQSTETGNALVLSKNADIDAELKRRKIALSTKRGRRLYEEEATYGEGDALASGVMFNDGLREEVRDRTLLLDCQ